MSVWIWFMESVKFGQLGAFRIVLLKINLKTQDVFAEIAEKYLAIF